MTVWSLDTITEAWAAALALARQWCRMLLVPYSLVQSL